MEEYLDSHLKRDSKSVTLNKRWKMETLDRKR